jgi:hypothetical protein
MAVAAQDEEHMLILACLSGLYAESVIGRCGGSAPDRQMLEKLVKFAELCWIFGSNGRLFLKNAEHRTSTVETVGTSTLPVENFIQSDAK